MTGSIVIMFALLAGVGAPFALQARAGVRRSDGMRSCLWCVALAIVVTWGYVVVIFVFGKGNQVRQAESQETDRTHRRVSPGMIVQH